MFRCLSFHYFCQQKLNVRKKVVKESSALTAEEKKRVSEILSLKWMSSEESASDSGQENTDDNSGDDEVHRPRVKVFLRKTIPWRSRTANSYMESLDRKAARRRGDRASSMMRKRKTGAPSLREAPTDAPAWALDNSSR